MKLIVGRGEMTEKWQFNAYQMIFMTLVFMEHLLNFTRKSNITNLEISETTFEISPLIFKPCLCLNCYD